MRLCDRAAMTRRPPHTWDADGPDDDLADLAALVGTRIASPAAAARLVQDLVGPEAYGPPALWCVLLDADDRVLPLVLAISERPLVVSDGFAQYLADDLAAVLEQHAVGGSVVVALVGDGDEDVCGQLSWVVELERTLGGAGVPMHAIVAVGPHGPAVLAPV